MYSPVNLMRLKKRHRLNNKTLRKILRWLSETLNVDSTNLKIDNAEIADHESGIKILIVDDNIVFVVDADNIFPTLYFEPLIELLPSLIVDMGAVPYICNGADVMAPGVVRIEGTFGKDSIVVVRDEKHGKPIAIARSLSGASQMKQTRRGKVAETLHYVGDEIWNLAKHI